MTVSDFFASKMLAGKNVPSRDILIDSIREHIVRKWDGVQERFIPAFRNFLGKRMWETYLPRTRAAKPQNVQNPAEPEKQEPQKTSVMQKVALAITEFFNVMLAEIRLSLFKKNRLWHVNNPFTHVEPHLAAMPQFATFGAWLDSI